MEMVGSIWCLLGLFMDFISSFCLWWMRQFNPLHSSSIFFFLYWELLDGHCLSTRDSKDYFFLTECEGVVHLIYQWMDKQPIISMPSKNILGAELGWHFSRNRSVRSPPLSSRHFSPSPLAAEFKALWFMSFMWNMETHSSFLAGWSRLGDTLCACIPTIVCFPTFPHPHPGITLSRLKPSWEMSSDQSRCLTSVCTGSYTQSPTPSHFS